MCVYGKKGFLIFFFLLIFSHVVLPNTCLAEIAVIKVHFRDASDMLPMVETMLSPEGKASVYTPTNSIVIRDSSESLMRIRELLAHLDKPGEQVTIRFRFQKGDIAKQRDISASGRISGERGSVSIGEKGRKDGVRVRAGSRTVNHSQESESFISVLSGSAAYISVGKEILYSQRWAYLCRRYAHFANKVAFKRIETGMEVRPVLSGDHVHIEIIPRVSYEEPGDKGVIRFSEASTKLFIRRGQWITIGGHAKKSNEVIREILSRRSAEDGTTISLSLMVEP